jgi:hypothetical protein
MWKARSTFSRNWLSTSSPRPPRSKASSVSRRTSAERFIARFCDLVETLQRFDRRLNAGMAVAAGAVVACLRFGCPKGGE